MLGRQCLPRHLEHKWLHFRGNHSFWIRDREREKENIRRKKVWFQYVKLAPLGAGGGYFNSCQMFREKAERKFSTFADAFREAPAPSVCAKAPTPVPGASEGEGSAPGRPGDGSDVSPGRTTRWGKMGPGLALKSEAARPLPDSAEKTPLGELSSPSFWLHRL